MKTAIFLLLISVLFVLTSCETETAPDLIPDQVENMKAGPIAKTDFAFRSMTLKGVIRNIGDEESDPCKVQIQHIFSYKVKPLTFDVPSIPAGGLYKWYFQLPGDLKEEYRHYFITVDPDDLIYEKNEENNVMAGSFWKD